MYEDNKNWDVLYHFTSLQNFVRIIKEGKISLTDVSKSNDPAEGMFVLNALKEAYPRMMLNDEIKTCTYKKYHEVFFDFFEEETAFERTQQAILSLSFCEPEILLPLWRTYGDNGKGVNFGIAKNRLLEFGKKKNFKFKKVEYLSKTEINERAINFWKDCVNDDEKIIRKKLSEFYINGYFIKRKENFFEREWRLIYSGIDLSKYILIQPKTPDMVNLFSKDDDIVLTYDIDIKEDEWLDHINLGPQCKATSNEIKLFLSKYGIRFNSVAKDNVVMR